MLCMKQDIKLGKLYVRCIRMRNDIQNLQSSQCRTLKESTFATNQYRGCLKAAEFEIWKRDGGRGKALRGLGKLEPGDVSLSPGSQTFLEVNVFRLGERVREMYYSFALEPSYNLHLGPSKMLKDCMVSYLSSDVILANVSKGRAKPKPLVQIRIAVFEDALCSFLVFKEKRSACGGNGFLNETYRPI